MGNTFKSNHSRKSYNPKRTTETFRDYATALPPDSGGNAMSPEDRMSLRLSHGTPGLKDGMFHYPSHSFSFNHQRGIVNWTLELITPENYTGNEIDKNDVAWNIMKDKNVDYRGEMLKDYISTQYNEMACSEVHKHNKEELKATRLTTNFVIGGKNTAWCHFQLYPKSLFDKALMSRTWVFSGPLFDTVRFPYLINGQFEPAPNIRYRATTDNLIAIPNQLFKVFLAEADNKLYLACYRMDNCRSDTIDVRGREVHIKDLEKITGFHIFPHFHPDYSSVNSLTTFLTKSETISYKYSLPFNSFYFMNPKINIEEPIEPSIEEVKSSSEGQSKKAKKTMNQRNAKLEGMKENAKLPLNTSESLTTQSGALEGQSINPTDPHDETSSLSLDKLSDIITEPKKQEDISKHLTDPLEVNSQSSVTEMSNEPPISIKIQFDKSLENLTSHRKELKSHVGLLETHGEKLNAYGKDLKSHKEELKTHTELMKTFIKSSASGASVTLSSKSK